MIMQKKILYIAIDIYDVTTSPLSFNCKINLFKILPAQLFTQNPLVDRSLTFSSKFNTLGQENL